ncbi:hypothetical protein LPJ68_002266 [Coemansia sp. RSA 1086]|nr:hypothetical protein LPJ68_002266 [Coemansia sp. RSA 1086]
MEQNPPSWEDALFCPPSWPYDKDDPSAPTAHPTIKSYGYDIQALDALPVQKGYKNPRRHGIMKSITEAKQYYSQFQVFRDIMLDKQWAARQQASTTYPKQKAQSFCHQVSSTEHKPNAHKSEEYLQSISGQPRAQSSSTESGETVVSQDNSGSCRQNITRVFKDIQEATEQKSKKSQTRLSPSLSQGKTFAILRIPLLCGILLIIALELLAYFVIREIVALYEYVAIWRGRLGKLYGRLFAAPNYQAYLQLATVLDQQMGINLDNPKTLSHYYDAPLLMRITESLHELRLPVENSNADRKHEDKRRNVVALCDLLQQGALKANAGGWENRQIWSCSYSESTRVVSDYIEETVACIDCVRKSKDISPSEKLQFFRQVARQQGRMALCLSGGAAMGWKHLGVARCLLDEARLPRVISGTSAGSLVAALLGTHTDSELRQIIRPELVKYMTACQGSEWKRLARWLCKGYYFDAVEWAPRAQVFTRGSLTFLEAFERTGKLLNISCTPMGHRYSPRKLLNYITAPNVIIWSAVLASACLPGVMQPMVLLMKTRDGQVKPYTDSGVLWRDGSFRNDIPSTDLRASLNVQFTVVSQVNPHVSLFFYDRDGSIGQPPARRYSSVWRGGFIPSALEHMLKLDIRKWLRLLSDLNLMPLILSQDWSFVWLQKFDGDVTILPKSRISEYFKLLTDPTYNSIVQSIDEGTVATWPKLKMIKTRQGMEDAITRGWIEAYYECTRSSHLMRSIPTKVAMDVARTAKSIDQSEQRSESTISKAYEALSDVSDNENSVVFRALHSMHPQTGLLNRHKLTHKERHRLRNRRQHALASNKYPKPTYAQILAEEDCSSSSIAEDVWTG